MTRRNKLYITLGVVGILGLGATGFAAASYEKHRDHHAAYEIAFAEDGDMKRHGKFAMRRKGMMRMLERYDTNGDNALGIDEVISARQSTFSTFDTDGDGTLTLSEYEELWQQEMRSRMVDRFQRLDDNGDGSISLDDYNKRVERMLTFMDRNEDGVVSREDRRHD